MANENGQNIETKKPKQDWYENKLYIILWLIFFFPVGIYGVWKYPTWSKRTKWVLTALPAVLIMWSMISSSMAPPEIKLSDANTTKEVSSGDYRVSGSISPTFSKVKVNGNDASVDSEGNFSFTVSLKDGTNEIVVVATNAGKTTQAKQSVKKLTAEEVAKRKAEADANAKANADKAKADADAKAKADAEKAEATKELDANVRLSSTAFMIKNQEASNWSNCKFVLNGKLFGSDFTYKTSEGIPANDSVIVLMSDFTKSDGTMFNPYTTKPKNLFISCDVGSNHRTGYFTISE